MPVSFLSGKWRFVAQQGNRKDEGKLDLRLRHPFNPEGTFTGIPDDSLARIAEAAQQLIRSWREEITRLEKWRGALHPFLTKAVMCNESTRGFFLGQLVDLPFLGFSASVDEN